MPTTHAPTSQVQGVKPKETLTNASAGTDTHTKSTRMDLLM